MSGSGPPALSPRESAILTRTRPRKVRETIRNPRGPAEVIQGAAKLVFDGSAREIEEVTNARSFPPQPDQREARGRKE